MTEQEAKTKTCHRTLAPVASADGSAPWHSPAPCIGSDCMAFRSHLTAHEILPVGEVPKRDGLSPVGEPVGAKCGRVQEWARHEVYCGLAGKP